MNNNELDEVTIGELPFFSPSASPAAVPGSPTVPSGPAAHLLAAAGRREQTAAQIPDVPTMSAVPFTSGSAAFELSRQLDWAVVDRLRNQVSDLQSKSLEENPSMSDADQQEIARAHIKDVVRLHTETMIQHGGGVAAAWDPAMQEAVSRAVFDSIFKLGRLQPLVELDGAENIDIYGHDNVWVTYSDGTKRKHDPVAGSDAELIAEIQFLAAQGGEDGRSFTASSPILDMDLPGGARLAAVHPPISPRATAVIRIHRFVDIDLEDLVTEKKTISRPAKNLLEAAMAAGLSAVVSGHPGVGKTTLVRALANCIHPEEKIITIEKERELYLDRMGDRHKIVKSLQYRPGQGERLPDGSRPGEVTLVDCLEEALRLDAQRIIVGEVRGGEIDAMFQAMQAGVGSLSTLHASSATNAIERMATLTQKNLGTTDTYAYRQIAQHINLIVQVSKLTDRRTGGIRRIVTEISEVQKGEAVDGARPIAAPIFQADPYTHELVPVGRPTTALLEDLKRAGFNERDLITNPDGAL